MENCIDKKHRLRTSAELGFMRENALKAVGRYCVFNVYRKEEEGEHKFAIITSRRFHKHAVQRNRARRLLKEAYRRLFPNLASAWIVLLPRRYILKAKMDDVLEEMKRLAQELDVYCAENE